MVVHDLPIRPQRRQPDEIYGRAYRRDPEAWLARKRKKRANLARLARVAHLTNVEIGKARRRRGWALQA